MHGNGPASQATAAALCELLTPLCSLRESCQLWREFAQRLQDSPPRADCVGCDCGCQHCCHGNSSGCEYATVEDSPPPAVALFAGSAADVRQAAFDSWLAAKKRSGASCDAGRGAARAAAEAAAATEAADQRRRREEGDAAYASWLLGKKRLGSGGGAKRTGAANEQEPEEAQQKKADAEAAIARWRERKDAELGERQRTERRRQAEAARVKEAAATDRQATAASAMDAWASRKADSLKQARRGAPEEREQSETDLQLRDEEKRANSSRAFQEWSARKAASKKSAAAGSAAESESGGAGQPRKRAWRPNATSRRR